MDSEFIYHCSKTLLAFIERSKGLLRQILSQETGIQARTTTFTYQGHIYPISIVAFEHKTRLGYFNSDLWEIGLNKELLFYNDDFLKEILRHELAHYITFIEYGEQAPHGSHFRSICRRYGWNEEMRATIDNDVLEDKKPKEVLQKVSKLIELSKSSNVHEAQLAMSKAKELLLKHQLTYIEESDAHLIKRVLVARTANQKMHCIAEILRQFFVYPVINKGRSKVYLEIFGKEVHVEIAEYIAIFLDRKLEELWQAEKGRTTFKGIRAKHSFFHGVAKGFLEKERLNKQAERALVLNQRHLEESIHFAYPRLRSSTHRSQRDNQAYNRGKTIGGRLTIDSPLKKERGTLQLS